MVGINSAIFLAFAASFFQRQHVGFLLIMAGFVAVALPQRVQPAPGWVVARPTGFRLPGTHAKFGLIAIEDASDRDVAAGRGGCSQSVVVPGCPA